MREGRRRHAKELAGKLIGNRGSFIALPETPLIFLLVLACAAGTLASASACPEEVSVSIFSPMQGDVVSEGGSLLSFGVAAKGESGDEGIKADIELDGQKLEVSMADLVGQATIDGLSNGIHSIRVLVSCGGRTIEGGVREVSFLYANPVEDEHDQADALLSWARTHEYRERVELMVGAMRQFAAANAEAMAEMQAKVDALQEANLSCLQTRI